MPLEIRELVIKTTVNRDRPDWQFPLGGKSSTPLREQDRAALVAACVEQVLAVLADKTER